MTFGEKLRVARKQKKLTQKGLASLINAAHNSISNWENDQNKPDPDTIQNLCWALNVAPNYFFSVSDAGASQLPMGLEPRPTTNKVPRVGGIACGTPILAEENIECYDDIPSWIKCDFTLTCHGDSMIGARIYDGDVVCIHQQPEVENGEIAAVMVDDDTATLKRVRKFDDHIILEPENPSHRPQTFWDADMARVRILGKATHFISAIR